MESLFDNYWEFLKKREEFRNVKRPILRWYSSDNLNELQKTYFEFVKDAKVLLDFGAGDLSLKSKFLKAGFQGEYKTCDISKDFQYDYHSLDEVIQSKTKFDAILILEVIEHLTLNEFREFLPKILNLVNPGGRLILSTPNPHAINAVWSTDLTHVKSYPQPDLWALLTLKGFECAPYRVIWSQEKSVSERMKIWVSKIITHFLGVDYATGTTLLCRRNPTHTAR